LAGTVQIRPTASRFVQLPAPAVQCFVPIARLNRDKLRALAADRLEEARVLLQNRFWTGAYYMTGLAVECALKSCLASEVREHDFPDKQFVTSMYVHRLEPLFRLNGALWVTLQIDMQADPKLRANWSTVKDWDDNKRYDIVEELEARALYEAASEAASGVMEWIRGKW
jgi:HEPN domain-containing protein